MKNNGYGLSAKKKMKIAVFSDKPEVISQKISTTVMEHFKDTSLNLIMVVYIAKNTAVYQNKVDIIICQKPFNGSAVEQIQRQSPRKS